MSYEFSADAKWCLKKNNPFEKIKGRYLVLMWILPFLYLPGSEYVLSGIGRDWSWYWVDLFYDYYSTFLFAVTILILAVCSKLNWASLVGRTDVQGELLGGLKLTLFLFFFSIATAYLLFIPLSYVMPKFVEWWYIDVADIIYFDAGYYPRAANVFGFMSLVMIAPVIEEAAFRGILLHRWTRKWGLITAMLLSSLLFGVLHADPIGAIAFGIGMCILYLRTQSLLIPIFCHAVNNLVVWLIEAGWRLAERDDYSYTLDDFRSEWYLGVLSGIVVFLWAFAYFRKPQKYREWKLPIG